MVRCRDFYRTLLEAGVTLITGVPDSTLRPFLAYLQDHHDIPHHTAPNEGSAVALAAGHHLATGTVPLVYMQNSGLGNAVNPLTSLTSPYNIPMLLLIGHRGASNDEPQHQHMGAATWPILDAINIWGRDLPPLTEAACDSAHAAHNRAIATQSPQALIVRRNTFLPYDAPRWESSYTMKREEAIKLIVSALDPEDIIVATTGKISRELAEHAGPSPRIFLNVGAMGHASMIAAGIALAKPERRVVCLDGDGALLMHTGALAFIGEQAPSNLLHIVLNNGCHDSVGGQPTAAPNTDIPELAYVYGYCYAHAVSSPYCLKEVLGGLHHEEVGPCLLEVHVAPGSRSNLGRPATTPVERKEALIEHLRP